MTPLPGVSTLIWVEALTLLVRGRGGQTSSQRRSSVVLQRELPCEPKTVGVLRGQRHEIDAWIRSREVKCALPQRVSVLELECICNLLFFKETEGSTTFS